MFAMWAKEETPGVLDFSKNPQIVYRGLDDGAVWLSTHISAEPVPCGHFQPHFALDANAIPTSGSILVAAPTAIPPRPAWPYLGKKRNLARRICAIIDGDPHSTYAGPLVGMGGIFLRRDSKAHAEFTNDAGRDVTNLFRILQVPYVAVLLAANHRSRPPSVPAG